MSKSRYLFWPPLLIFVLSLQSCSIPQSNFHQGKHVNKLIDKGPIPNFNRSRTQSERYLSRTISNNSHRIPQIAYPSPKLVVTPEVTKEIKNFSEKNRKFIVNSYNNRSELYDELIELFTREGVPLELLNVGVIESGFKPEAVSSSGAAGIWQFMKGTARNYGLSVGFFRDERKDPIRSTWAAVRHLKDLYNEFGDWYLALAAYNAGSGAVRRAIKKGRTKDFWRLARAGHFHSQTANYVPRFVAVTIIMQNLSEYGFTEMAGELNPGPILLSYAK